MQYLTIEAIITINEEVQAKQGSQSLLRDRNVLESAVARPQMTVFGEDAYPTVFEKAAALLHSLVLNHPFVDGNKRTATVALIIFLNNNGWLEHWTVDDAHAFIIAVAEGKHDVPAIVAWLRANTSTIPHTPEA